MCSLFRRHDKLLKLAARSVVLLSCLLEMFYISLLRFGSCEGLLPALENLVLVFVLAEQVSKFNEFRKCRGSTECIMHLSRQLQQARRNVMCQ